MKRKVVTIDGNGTISVIEDELRDYGPNELLVEVKASLVSPGTELGSVKQRREKAGAAKTEPKPFGYQNAGIVLEKGESCESYEVGQRVACMGGGYGQHASYAVVPKNMAVPIPENVSFEEAAFNHLGATALQAVRRAQLQIGEYVAVVGLGIVGQIAAQLARLSGCRAIGIDLLPMRLKLAKELGAHLVLNPSETDAQAAVKEFTEGWGLDAAIMAFGGNGTEAFKMLLGMMKTAPDTHRMGRIVIVGGCEITTKYASACGNIDVRSSARTGPGYHDEDYEQGKNYPPVFVQWDTQRNLKLVLALISEGQLRVEPLITHRLPLDEAPRGCDELIEHPERSLGVIFQP